jgi:hypothetical protein
MKMHRPLAFLYAVAAVAVLHGGTNASHAPNPARAQTSPGSIAGQLVAATDPPQPVRRAQVMLNRVDGPGGAAEITDDDGRFRFVNVPEGRYLLSAAKAGMVRVNYGETRPGRPGSAIALGNGETLDTVVVRMLPGAVITGTVLDPLGSPAPGVEVQVLRVTRKSGSPQVQELASERTDDRGVYRVFGLGPGEYAVAAQPRFRYSSGAARETTAADVERARRLLANPRASAGAADLSRPLGLAVVFHPATTEPSNAATITLSPGQERGGVDIALQLIPLSMVRGRLVWPGGTQPSPVTIMMVPLMSSPLFTLHGLGHDEVEQGGDTFTIRNLAPGRYGIVAQTASLQHPQTSGGSVLTAAHEVEVAGSDIDGVTLVLQPGGRVSGRVTIDEPGEKTAFGLSRVSLSLRPDTTRPLAMRPARADVKADGAFEITGIPPGRYRLAVQLPRNAPGTWHVRAATISGVNVLDDPIELRSDTAVTDAVVTLSTRSTELSGVMQDAAGRPAPEHYVVVFSTDRQRWFQDSRHIQAVRPASDGRFTARALPAGEYHVAALTDVEDGEWFDPAFLDRLVPASIRVTLREGEKTVQDIRMK